MTDTAIRPDSSGLTLMTKVDMKTFQTTEKSTWCAGCGDFGILASIKQALVGLNLAPHQVMFFSGIGCGSKLPHYMHVSALNTIHGRALPVATGFKLANHNMKVVAITGDGDGYGIGMGHLAHTMRRNPDITHIVENNQVYGLTKGQYSPTSGHGYISTTSPEGSIEVSVNPLALGMAMGASFLARSFSSDPKHLASIIMKAMTHKGYALVDVLQPCVTYNHVNTNEWYKSRVYKVEDLPNYDPTNRQMAYERAQEWGDRIPMGVIYADPDRPTYEDQVPLLQKGTLLELSEKAMRKDYDYESLKNEYM